MSCCFPSASISPNASSVKTKSQSRKMLPSERDSRPPILQDTFMTTMTIEQQINFTPAETHTEVKTHTVAAPVLEAEAKQKTALPKQVSFYDEYLVLLGLPSNSSERALTPVSDVISKSITTSNEYRLKGIFAEISTLMVHIKGTKKLLGEMLVRVINNKPNIKNEEILRDSKTACMQ